ncbi:MAG: hypothetical protein ACE5DT_05320 [Nitrosopumilus sp.]
MTKQRSFFLIFILLFSSTPIFDDVYGHSMFNSAEKFEAGYRVQVATAPEFPQIGEPSQFLVKVTKGYDYEDVDRFTMGMRIMFNGQQVDAVQPTSIEGSHWDFDYIWRNSGNHIVMIDLYDIGKDGGVVTYKFNMGTQSPFGYIFFAAITVGALSLTGVVVYIYLPQVFKKSKV